ncbi:MAG TPA: four helix bundle protein [Nitrospiraceae bacterium]|nr:four helix bundle protein [Nitrospiraceae bacterium]
MDDTKFGFEELQVWQKAVEFACRVIQMTGDIETDRKHFRLIENCEAAATSIAVNIAEGKGRYSKKEFVQYLYIARGSLFETITALIIFERSAWISKEQLNEMKQMGSEIGKMLISLIKSIKTNV